jgi:hypothetical protein
LRASLALILALLPAQAHAGIVLAIQGPGQVNTGSCTEYKVIANEADGTPADLQAAHAITLSATGVADTVFSNSSCSASAAVDVGPGTAPAVFYVKAPATAGSGNLSAATTANVSGWSPATLPVKVVAPPPPSPVYLERPPAVSCTVSIAPGEDIASQIAAGKAVVCLEAGVHRIASKLGLLTNQTLYGEPGAVLNGSVVVSPVKSGSYYVASVPSVSASTVGSTNCQSGFPECYVPNDVYVNNVLYTKVASLSAVGAGDVYLDKSAMKIYMLDNPSGKTVEYTVASSAVTGESGSRLEGLVVEKFANDGFTVAIDGSHGMTIAYNELRYAHGQGLNGGPMTQHNFVHHCGLNGLDTIAGTSGAVFQYNEVSFNNTAHYDYFWAGGGSKFWKSTGTVVKYNYVHDNYGRGLWDDTDNTITYANNIVANNQSDGIIHEVGHAATIENNTISGNHDGVCLIAFPRHDEGIDRYLENVVVENNKIDLPAGSGYHGILEEGTPYNNPLSAGNKFEGNSYTFGDTADHFILGTTPISYSQWQSEGYQ